MQSTSRYYMFTLNNPTENGETFLKTLSELPGTKFAIFQLEKGAEGTLHFQGYLGLKRAQRFSYLKRHVSAVAHWEARRTYDGCHLKCIAYCSKEDTRVDGPWEFGELDRGVGQGFRTDLARGISILRRGGLKRLAEEEPELLVKYSSGFASLAKYLPPPVRTLPEIYLFFGSTGTGKTRTATTYGDFYKHEPRSNWFDCYTRQGIFLLDEYTGWWKLDYFLSFTDVYDHRLQIKHGHEWLDSPTLIITTNVHPSRWYHWTEREEQYAAMARRFNSVFLFRRSGSPQLVLPGSATWDKFWSIDKLGPLDPKEFY